MALRTEDGGDHRALTMGTNGAQELLQYLFPRLPQAFFGYSDEIVQVWNQGVQKQDKHADMRMLGMMQHQKAGEDKTITCENRTGKRKKPTAKFSLKTRKFAGLLIQKEQPPPVLRADARIFCAALPEKGHAPETVQEALNDENRRRQRKAGIQGIKAQGIGGKETAV